jgi:hypothetical protein
LNDGSGWAAELEQGSDIADCQIAIVNLEWIDQSAIGNWKSAM